MPCLDGSGAAAARAAAAPILAAIRRPGTICPLPPSSRNAHAGDARSTGVSAYPTVSASALVRKADPKEDGMDRFEPGLPTIGRRRRSMRARKPLWRCRRAVQPADRSRPTRFQELKKNHGCADADKAAGHQMKELEP